MEENVTIWITDCKDDKPQGTPRHSTNHLKRQVRTNESLITKMYNLEKNMRKGGIALYHNNLLLAAIGGGGGGGVANDGGVCNRSFPVMSSSKLCGVSYTTELACLFKYTTSQYVANQL